MGEKKRITQAELAQQLYDEIHRRLAANELTDDEVRQLIAIFKAALEREELRKQHGGPTAAQIQSN